MKKTLLVLLTVCIAFFSRAQISIRVEALNSLDLKPAQNISIQLQETKTKNIIEAHTNENGVVGFTKLTAGRYTVIVASGAGFASLQEDLTVTVDNQLYTLYLTPQNLSLLGCCYC